MKKRALLFITLVLLLCFFLLDCSVLFPECSATIRIYNERASDLFVTIDDERKAIPGWGSCLEAISETQKKIVACSAFWDLRWPKPTSTSCWQEEEQKPEPECEEKSYNIVVEGVSGLDKSITVNNEDFIALTIDIEGTWK